MATGNGSKPRSAKSTSGGEDAAITRGIRVCYVGTPTEGSNETGLLSELGAKIERYSTAEEGFTAVLELDFDLLLVNLTANTGGMGGPEFVRLIRTCGHPTKSQLPIVAIASQRQLQHASRLQALGADELIGTPIDIAVLHAKIGNLLKKRRSAGGARAQSSLVRAPTLSQPQDRSDWDKGERTPTKELSSGGARATSVARPELAKDVAPMKQKFDMSQMAASAQSGQAASGAQKGFLERLSDRILARLSKTSAETPAAMPERHPPSFAGAAKSVAKGARENPALTRPGNVDSEQSEISEVLRGLGRNLPPADSEPVQSQGLPAATGLRQSPRGLANVTASSERDEGSVSARQTYISPIRRAGGVSAQSRPTTSQQSKPTSVRAVARTDDVGADKVYDRVKKLVSNARRASDVARPNDGGRKSSDKTLRICFLEDSCTSSHAIREMLGEFGHEVDHFSQAEEAFDAFEEKNYDLLLASQVEALGGMDSMQLLRQVRRDRDQTKRGTPIVVLTTGSDSKNLRTFRDAGANDVIVKPIEGKRLHEQIQRVVGDRREVVPRARDTRGLKVCFLEDSCTSSHAIREMLGDERHEVDHFSSAEEALDAVMEKNYDVLLASQIVAIGGMDCLGLIKTIRSATDPAKRQLPIVAITANPDSANLEPFFIAGASDVVVKPIEGKELNKRLTEIVVVPPKPVVDPSPAAASPRREKAQAMKICFLEDSCTSSHAIREMLGEKGHEVDHFSSAEEALDALTEKNYDLLLASQIVALGGMDCEQLVRTVRSGARLSLPIAVITANPEPDNLDKFQQAGANDVILKPVEGNELNDRLFNIVRAKAAPVSVTAPKALPKKLNVCFLEDSCTSSHAIREMLGEQGHEVDHFSSAEEALDAFQEKDYDVLLASQIPGMGGLDTEGLVRRVRTASGVKKQRPVVLLTTDPSSENQQRFRRAGVNEIVIKPIEGNLGHRLADIVARGRAAPAKTTTRQPANVPAHLRICFLEDSCTSSHAIREMLGESGHEVDHFSSAEEALDAFLEKPYDLLLASQIVALGGLDCEGLVKTVRGHGKSAARHSPIVVITANGDPANVESFMRVGADEVIIKPIEGNLSAKLHQVVERVVAQPPVPQLRVVTPAKREAVVPRLSVAKTPPSSPAAAPKKSPLADLVGLTQSPPPDVPKRPVSFREIAAGGTPPAPAGAASTPPIPPPTAEAREMPRLKFPDVAGLAASSATKRSAARTGLSTERKVIAAMFVVGISAVVAMNWHHISESTPVNVVTVERAPIFSSLNAPGMIVSKKKVELTTAVPGQITRVLVKEGDKVAKGDVLATLDDRDARIQLQRAEANLESARKDVALNERTMDRLVRALQMGAVSRQMAEDAEAAVNAARAKQRVAEEESRAAQLLAERLNVIAPFNGVVTASYAVEGLWAEPPGPLFTVVDLQQLEVELHIDAADVNRVSVGQRVTLSSDAGPGQWSEQIVRVAPAASRSGNMANVVNVYTTLGADAPTLHFGQQIDGQIRIAANENAVRIPFAALTTRNQRSVVGVVEDGHLVFKPVSTGIESGTHVEIRDGLKAGDEVILINKELEEGIRVTPVDLHD